MARLELSIVVKVVKVVTAGVELKSELWAITLNRQVTQ